MPRSRKKTKISHEPITVGDALKESPIAQILADHETKAQPAHEQPDTHAEAVAAFQRQRDRDQAVSHVDRLTVEPERERPTAEDRIPTSFAAAVTASRAAFAPIADGFVNVDSYPAAGLKVNRSLDRKVAAIQFSEDRPLSRATEYDKMRKIQDAGFVYKTAHRQWERYDAENPGANIVDAKRIAADLAKERQGLAR